MTAPPSTYPVKGIFYFFSNWNLVRRIICILFLTLVVALLAIGFTFGILLRLQAHGLINAGCPEWLAWIVSVIFCLLEAVISTTIFYLIITPIWQDALFDDVLRLKGVGHVLEKHNNNTSELTLCCRGFCSGLAITLAFVFSQIVIILITMPLHVIPVIGTMLYCYINGWVMTWGHQIHYHIEIKDWTVKKSFHFAWKNHDNYTMFGFIAVALELIPIANFLFFWTNVVGAALWTADVIIEEQTLLSSENGNIINDGAEPSSYQAAQRMDGSNKTYGSTDG